MNSQIKRKFVGPNEIDGSKILIGNDEWLRGRNFADDNDVNLIKVNADDDIELASVPVVGGEPLALVSDISANAVTTARASTTSNINISSAPTTYDGVTASNGDLILVAFQSSAAQNGLYTFNGAGSPLTRAPGWDTSGGLIAGRTVYVREGTGRSRTTWTLQANVATVDTSAVNFSNTGFDSQFAPNFNNFILPRSSGGFSIGSLGLPVASVNVLGSSGYWLTDGSVGFHRWTYSIAGSGSNGAPPYSGTQDVLFTNRSQSFNIVSLNGNSTFDTASLSLRSGHQASGGANTGSISLISGNAQSTGNSGGVLIQTGTVVSGTRGKIRLVDGSEGTTGHVWTSTGTDGSGGWAAPSGGANLTLSNLSSPTAINQSLLPSGTRSIGNPGFTYWQDLALGGKIDFYDQPGFSNRYEAAVFASAQASPSGATSAFALRGVSAGRSIGIYSATASSSTGSVLIASGNSTTSGNTGDIELYIGTVTSGTRGKIKFKDGSEGTAGHVWTSTGTDGSGAWAAIVPPSVGNISLELNTGNGQGSTANRTRRWSNVGSNTLGAFATYVDSATDGGTVTVNIAGIYSITYNDAGASGNPNFGITVNANGADTILTVTPAQRRTVQCGVSANVASSSWTGWLAIGDVIRFQTDTATPLNAFAGCGARVSYLGT